MKKQRIQVLTAAGFTANSDFFGITTTSLTEDFKNADIGGIRISKQTPALYFYNLIENYYDKYEDFKLNKLSYLNFETILNLLEDIYTFIIPFKSNQDYKHSKINMNLVYQIGMKPSIFELKSDVLDDLWQSVVKNNGKNEIKNVQELIKFIYLKLIEILANKLDKKSRQKKVSGISKFVKFLDTNFKNKDFYRRIYTLNYDYWINKNHPYFWDGFNNNGIYVADLNDKSINRDCYFSVHGCVNWKLNTNSNSVKKSDVPLNYELLNQYSTYQLNRDPLIISPIISGYNKTQRISLKPFHQIYNSFAFDNENADLLIIIGYGFYDSHLNSLISNRTKPILIIDYKPNLNSKNNYLAHLKKNVFMNKKNFRMAVDAEFFKNTNIKIYFNGIGDEFYKWYSLNKLS